MNRWYTSELGLVLWNLASDEWFVFDSYLNQVYGNYKVVPALTARLSEAQARTQAGYDRLSSQAAPQACRKLAA